MSSHWAVRTLTREARENVLRGGARSALLILGLALAVGAPGLLEARTVQDLMERDRTEARQGAYVLAVQAANDDPVGLDGAACEALNAQGGIIRAGAVTSNELVPLAASPGTRVRRLTVTPGLPETLRLLVPGESPAVIVGPELATELGLGIGAFTDIVGDADPAFVITGIAAPASLLHDAERAIVEVRPASPQAQVCYVAIAPTLYREMRAGGLLGLADLADRTPSLADLVPRGSGLSVTDAFHGRQTRLAPLAGAIIGLVLLQASRQSRRSERAVYRTTGTSVADLRLLLCLETLVALAAALTIAVATFATLGRIWETPAPAIRLGLHAAATGTLLVVGVDLVLGAIAASSKRILEQLKDR